MVAGVGDLVDADQPPRLQRPPSRDAADQAEAPVQRFEQLARPRRHRRLLRSLDDRRQGAVDVGEDCRPGGIRAQRVQAACAAPAPVSDSSDTASSIAARCPRTPALPSHPVLKLAAIGTLAGAFSGLFGVGGGTVIVPLLIFWFGYGERLATGTSLAAIVLIGLLGAIAQGGIYGNVHIVTGLLLAIPAVVGVVIGTAMQQRISQRMVSILFAALLIGIAIELVLK